MNVLWLIIGNGSNPQNFGQDLSAFAGMITEAHFSRINEFSWGNRGSLETYSYVGQDCIYAYWGDQEGEFVRTLSIAERQEVEQHVQDEQTEAKTKEWC